MFWIIGGALFAIWVLWKFYLKPFSYWSSMGVPQTTPCIFLGDSWPTILRRKTLMESMNWLYYKYPDSKVMGMYQFYIPTLLIRDIDLIKQLTVKDFDHFTDHQGLTVDEEIDPLWGKNLFSLKGQRWRDMRALLSGSFTSSKMRIMYGLIAEESEKFVNYFLTTEEKVLDVELKDKFTRYTNDVIASTAFGIKVDSLENQENDFFLMGKEISNFATLKVLLKFVGLLISPRLFKFFNIKFISDRVARFFSGIIEENIKTREEQGIVRPDMINLLLAVKKGANKTEEHNGPDEGFAVAKESPELAKPHKKIQITTQDIIAQALQFFLAGFDSVATSMCYTCYELALDPDVQNKLRKEITDTFKKTNGKPTYEDILGVKYLDMVVTEALRKWPVAPAVDRVCVKPYTLQPLNPGDPTITLKKNDSIVIPIYNIHHDPKYYHDPEKFIPERFSEENKSDILPSSYLPFGIGPRACIGSRFALLEMKSVLFHLFNSFEITPSEKTQIPLKMQKASINISPIGGFPLRLKRV